jgi:hypothetical protein
MPNLFCRTLTTDHHLREVEHDHRQTCFTTATCSLRVIYNSAVNRLESRSRLNNDSDVRTAVRCMIGVSNCSSHRILAV